jgi:hypothetical protein
VLYFDQSCRFRSGKVCIAATRQAKLFSQAAPCAHAPTHLQCSHLGAQCCHLLLKGHSCQLLLQRSLLLVLLQLHHLQYWGAHSRNTGESQQGNLQQLG